MDTENSLLYRNIQLSLSSDIPHGLRFDNQLVDEILIPEAAVLQRDDVSTFNKIMTSYHVGDDQVLDGLWTTTLDSFSSRGL